MMCLFADDIIHNFCCEYCFECFQTESEFVDHFLEDHAKGEGHTMCTSCNLEILEDLEVHMKKEHPLNCIVCTFFVEEEDRIDCFDFLHLKCYHQIKEKGQDFLKQVFLCYGIVVSDTEDESDSYDSVG